jgi:hypothetical protein
MWRGVAWCGVVWWGGVWCGVVFHDPDTVHIFKDGNSFNLVVFLMDRPT